MRPLFPSPYCKVEPVSSEQDSCDPTDGEDGDCEEGCWCTSCRICIVLVLVLFTACLLLIAIGVFSADTTAKRLLVFVGDRAFGTSTDVGSMRVGIVSARTTIGDVSVANPDGYAGDFLTLASGVLDTSIWSLLSHRVELETLGLHQLHLSLEQNGTAQAPNFINILQSLNRAAHRKTAIRPPDFVGGALAGRKYVVDLLEMRDMSFGVNLRLGLGPIDLASPTTNFEIPIIKVERIGKNEGGVHLEELMLIVVNSVLSAAVEAMPTNVGNDMMATLDSSVKDFKNLDFESLKLDLGKGVREISKLIDRLSEFATANASATPKKPLEVRAGATFDSAVSTAADIADEMVDAISNSTTAWGEAIDGSVSPELAFEGAVNGTAAAFSNAMHGVAARTEMDGDVGKTVSKAINTAEAMGVAAKHAVELESDMERIAAKDRAANSVPIVEQPPVVAQPPFAARQPVVAQPPALRPGSPLPVSGQSSPDLRAGNPPLVAGPSRLPGGGYTMSSQTATDVPPATGAGAVPALGTLPR